MDFEDERKPKFYTQTHNEFNELANDIEGWIQNDDDHQIISLSDAEKFLQWVRGYDPKSFWKLEAFISISAMKEFIHQNSVSLRCYYSSSRWKEIRHYMKEKFNYTCQRCGDSKSELHVHHTNYNNFGNEDPATDLELLCKKCHLEHHKNPETPKRRGESKISKIVRKISQEERAFNRINKK